jgi:hypothetical protein
MSFVYGLLYMLMSAIPIIYGEMRGMTPFQATLPLLSVFIGILFGGILIFLDMGRYARMLKRKGEVSLPEQRFVPMGLGALLLREFRYTLPMLTYQRSVCSGSHSLVQLKSTQFGHQSLHWHLQCAEWY